MRYQVLKKWKPERLHCSLPTVGGSMLQAMVLSSAFSHPSGQSSNPSSALYWQLTKIDIESHWASFETAKSHTCYFCGNVSFELVEIIRKVQIQKQRNYNSIIKQLSSLPFALGFSRDGLPSLVPYLAPGCRKIGSIFPHFLAWSPCFFLGKQISHHSTQASINVFITL